MMSNLLDLSDRTILITGGCGALGQVIARILSEHGARIAVNDVLPEDQAQQALAEAGAGTAGVAYFRADTTRPDAVEALFDRVAQSMGMPNIVCCHAGMVDAYPVDRYPL